MGLKNRTVWLMWCWKNYLSQCFAPMLESYSHLNISKPIIPSQKKLFICFIKILLTGFFNKANDFYPISIKK